MDRISVLESNQAMMADNQEHLAANQARFFDLLIGPEVEQLDGQLVRDAEAGMVYKVDTVYEQTQNGGVNAKLRTGQRVLLWVAAIGGPVATVIAAAILK